ncbi:autotransporter outer membrane beta-barrel domain-containing protein, partial [Fusobacterium varium]|uniref:autotransporter outer membrane beta-barrel domain-containing protein n=1 Tax=Fusobacterium varium TaxID=856 RepID=UPI0021C441C6
MIEKIMKAVKSSNKRRGRNITIGAVIGFLLSCTAVMGTVDGNYLWIKDNDGIKFSTDNSEPALTDNPYAENNWLESTETYINNTVLSGNNNGADGIAYGVKLDLNSPNFRFINNGAINGSSDSNKAYGIYVDGGEVGNIENNGAINTSSDPARAYGIYVDGGEVGNIENNGIITGSSGNEVSAGIAILNNGGAATQIINRGIINNVISPNNAKNDVSIGIVIGSAPARAEKIINIGEINSSSSAGNVFAYGIRVIGEAREVVNMGNIKSFNGKSYGIGFDNKGSIDNLLNMGTISSFDSSNENYGIYSGSNATAKKKIVNTGVVYGQNNVIRIHSTGAIGDVNNYGIFATDGDSIISNDGTIGDVNNYGMYITKTNGQITITVDNDKLNDEPIEVVVGYDKDGNGITKSMTIRNAELNEDKTETVSFEFKGEVGKYNNSILNGKDETLKVSGKGNQITDSIINAYQTAVVMEGTKSSLVLNNTVVNGGAAKDEEVATIEIKGEHNALTLKGESIVNTGAENSIAITVEGKNNALVLEGNAKVNGEMTSTGTNNLISLNGNAGNGMNILHNISGFTNMNIDNNVTLFEDIKVTGTETVTVGGTLNLRLKKDTTTYSTIPTAVHAFSGREEKHEMTIKGASEEEAGTLNFITNGIGREIYVDMKNIERENMKVRANSIIDKVEISDEYIHLGAGSDLSGIVNPKVSKYNSLDKIYKSLYSSTEENLDALRDILSMTYLGTHYGYNTSNEEQLKNLMSYLDSIYTGTPYSVSSELSRRSAGMFRDIVTENQFRPDLNKWLVMGGLTHTDGGTKDSYYGQNYHGFDTGTADVDIDMKLTGAYALGKYGYSENVSLGVTAGGNKSEAKLPMAKVKGNSGYVGAFAENYRGNLTLKAGAGIQYSEYDANRATLGGHSYSEKYSDMAYDIYLNGRYSNPMGDNFFLEPYGTLSYTYVDQEGADEGSKVLAIETDSKTFDYTAAKVGLDIKKVILHEKGKSTLSAGVSYTRLLNGADKDN